MSNPPKIRVFASVILPCGCQLDASRTETESPRYLTTQVHEWINLNGDKLGHQLERAVDLHAQECKKPRNEDE